MRARSAVFLGLAIFLILGGSGKAQLFFAQDPPMEVTTDTANYCHHLGERVAAAERNAAEVPPDVARLASEGRRLCDKGLIRPGIERLRRAWRLLSAR